MIIKADGDLLGADVDALVNTVNTVGVMGKGLALQFRRAYPAMFEAYRRAADAGQLRLGRMHVWPTGAATGPRYIVNFPTKGHWRSRSEVRDIDCGLADLVRVVRELSIRSIAVPPLGCGNGGLDWHEIEPRIRSALAGLDDVRVVLYPPGRTPSAAEMTTRTVRPTMTLPRAALIRIIDRYCARALEISVIEVQKLLYFLRDAGEPLGLLYTKGRYGPYADNLRHALINLEGQYLTGFGDGNARVLDAEPLGLLPGAADAADRALADQPSTTGRIDHVLRLVEGFESPYGMELLASVHWIATREATDPTDPDQVSRLVRAWTPRKGRMFTAEHVQRAWHALRERGWLPPPETAEA
ncbi:MULTISPECIES: type II toxin-antitoxin system antitoxin DNA ADP-ribosyl glycohydrolase DarG [unclassified Frankia]|uniref:type II toxin-antitoxin system antitoxin DNA ADP-ribosyl glycohydrolase DarG n=1 Tax=unclassified Frankia TaxID=2632575 RepID=UPI0020244685